MANDIVLRLCKRDGLRALESVEEGAKEMRSAAAPRPLIQLLHTSESGAESSRIL